MSGGISLIAKLFLRVHKVVARKRWAALYVAVDTLEEARSIATSEFKELCGYAADRIRSDDRKAERKYYSIVGFAQIELTKALGEAEQQFILEVNKAIRDCSHTMGLWLSTEAMLMAGIPLGIPIVEL